MKKLLLLSSTLLFFTFLVNAQSVIKKFTEQKFVLDESKKSAEGNYFTSQSYNFKSGQILMISTGGKLNETAFNTTVVVKGVGENNQVLTPENKFHSNRDMKTEDLFLFTKTGNYTIYIANSTPGQKGEITNSIGLAWTSWIDSLQIFKITGTTPFARALGKILGHSIFQFNLMLGKQVHGSYIPTIELPGADMNSNDTRIRWNEKHVDSKLQSHSTKYTCSYAIDKILFPKILQEGGTEYPQFEKNYEFKDSAKIIGQYEKYKKILKETLNTEFTIEAESVNNIANGKEGEFVSGRTIVFKYKQKIPIVNPGDAGKYSFMYDKDIRVSLSLSCNNSSYNGVEANLLLSIYSY